MITLVVMVATYDLDSVESNAVETHAVSIRTTRGDSARDNDAIPQVPVHNLSFLSSLVSCTFVEETRMDVG